MVTGEADERSCGQMMKALMSCKGDWTLTFSVGLPDMWENNAINEVTLFPLVSVAELE